jgi:GAF domain-containing protein
MIMTEAFMADTCSDPIISYAIALGQLAVDKQTVVDSALDELLKWPGIDAAWVYLVTPTGDLQQSAARVVSAVAVHTLDLDEVAACAFGARECGIAPLPPAHPSGLRTIASFPLSHQDEQTGVLILGQLSTAPASSALTAANTIKMLSGAARLLSIAIANTQRYKQTQLARDRLAALHTTLTYIQRAATLHERMQLIANALHNLGWGHVTLWLCDDNLSMTDVIYAGISFQEETRLRQSPPPGIEVCRRPLEELQPFKTGPGYLVTKSSKPSVSWQRSDVLYIPLQSNTPAAQSTRPIWGSLELRHPTDNLRPGKDMLNAIELFAREAAHEIELARLLAEPSRRAEN